ncbi:MAG: hypothetical protein FWG18_04005 [Alphaproteobacteria bacterium]|nr:hypothetical protein [Alphaproteobacteria bacterium]
MLKPQNPSFDDVWNLLKKKGHGECVSSRGARYKLFAITLPAGGEKYPEGTKCIVAVNGNLAALTVCEDGWGKKRNLNGTWIGGFFNDVRSKSIYGWYDREKI